MSFVRRDSSSSTTTIQLNFHGIDSIEMDVHIVHIMIKMHLFSKEFQRNFHSSQLHIAAFSTPVASTAGSTTEIQPQIIYIYLLWVLLLTIFCVLFWIYCVGFMHSHECRQFSMVSLLDTIYINAEMKSCNESVNSSRSLSKMLNNNRSHGLNLSSIEVLPKIFRSVSSIKRELNNVTAKVLMTDLLAHSIRAPSFCTESD